MSDSDKILRSARKKPIFDPAELAGQTPFSKKDIERIIPHRDPLLLLDSIDAVSHERGEIVGTRYMDPADPVFAGHFPGTPLYPGNFTLEMIGQLGLCLYYFDTHKTDAIAADAAPVPARATRIAGAYYLEPIEPGKTVTILARKLDYDGYFASMIGQALVDGKVAVAVIGEVIILEN